MPESPRSPALAAIEPMDDTACRALLARHRLCTMSMVDGSEPYALPLFYGFDGTTLLIGLAEGRKTAVLDRNGRVCITVVETGEGDQWSSVLVTGRAEWLEGEAREQAVQVLTTHNRRFRGSTAKPHDLAAPDVTAKRADERPRRHSGGRLLRVADPTITGRTRP